MPYTMRGRAAMLTSRPLNNTQYIYHPTYANMAVGKRGYRDPSWYPGAGPDARTPPDPPTAWMKLLNVTGHYYHIWPLLPW